MKLLGCIALLAIFVATIGRPAVELAYYDIRLLMKADEVERCLHIAGGYRAFGHNVVCVDIRR
jgi:hypothetical protein